MEIILQNTSQHGNIDNIEYYQWESGLIHKGHIKTQSKRYQFLYWLLKASRKNILKNNIN